MIRNIKDVLHSLFVSRNSYKLVEFLRYFLVSVVSLGTDFLLLYLLTSLAGLHYLVSAVVSYFAGMFVNYFLSTYWVFTKRKISNRAAEFTVFAIIGIVGLGVNELLMWLLTEVVLLHYLISRIFSAGIGYVWKYIVRKYFLFR
ncbi:MAG: GtrA family protein [Spirochaetia bacterium]|jgi:putative flippase GtrA|nr:GtrA family protein [Spirochaetia bacterium]